MTEQHEAGDHPYRADADTGSTDSVIPATTGAIPVLARRIPAVGYPPTP